jgi:hypothetical protein
MGLTLPLMACTTQLAVNSVDPKNPQTRVGLPYPLTMTQEKIETDYRLTECGAMPKISVEVKVLETITKNDPKHTYTIDPNSLGSPLKTSAVRLEYHPNGAVKTLNAIAEDKTGDIIVSLGSAAVKIAKAASGIGGGPVPQEACKDDALKALNKSNALNDELDVATDDLSKATDKLTELKKKRLLTLVSTSMKGLKRKFQLRWMESEMR